MYVYIGYRNLPEYLSQQNQCGGTSGNTDHRLTTAKSGVYILTFGGQNYAVSTERAEKFTEEVLSKCTDKHRGFFPLEPSYNGKKYAAVIEIHKDRDIAYYDMDEEVLLQMLTALKDESGDPLDQRGLINYCYKSPVLPEGDFELKSIFHQIYVRPDNTPVSVMQTVKPDKRTSSFWIYKDEAHVEIREENNIKNVYDVPAELIPEIMEKVRELCKDPAEAYVEDGEWESYVRFGEDGEERIFTSPDNTLALLKDIASKSVFKESEEVKGLSYYGGAASRNAFNNFMFAGLNGVQGGIQAAPVQQPAPAQQQAPIPQPAPAPQTIQPAPPSENNGEKCLYCGAPRNGNKFCTECGGEFK